MSVKISISSRLKGGGLIKRKGKKKSRNVVEHRELLTKPKGWGAEGVTILGGRARCEDRGCPSRG